MRQIQEETFFFFGDNFWPLVLDTEQQQQKFSGRIIKGNYTLIFCPSLNSSLPFTPLLRSHEKGKCHSCLVNFMKTLFKKGIVFPIYLSPTCLLRLNFRLPLSLPDLWFAQIEKKIFFSSELPTHLMDVPFLTVTIAYNSSSKYHSVPLILNISEVKDPVWLISVPSQLWEPVQSKPWGTVVGAMQHFNRHSLWENVSRCGSETSSQSLKFPLRNCMVHEGQHGVSQGSVLVRRMGYWANMSCTEKEQRCLLHLCKY